MATEVGDAQKLQLHKRFFLSVSFLATKAGRWCVGLTEGSREAGRRCFGLTEGAPSVSASVSESVRAVFQGLVHQAGAELFAIAFRFLIRNDQRLVLDVKMCVINQLDRSMSASDVQP